MQGGARGPDPASVHLETFVSEKADKRPPTVGRGEERGWFNGTRNKFECVSVRQTRQLWGLWLEPLEPDWFSEVRIWSSARIRASG